MSYRLIHQGRIDIRIDAETLAPNILLFHALEGTEQLSQLFAFSLTCYSPRRDISVEKLIGKRATVSVAMPEGTRYFQGIFGRFEQGMTTISPAKKEITYYHATLSPHLGKLSLASDCRIFQNLSSIEIIKKILQEQGIPTQDKTHRAGRVVRPYCVQYNETHLHFLSRLMEAEGIFYFFEHSKGEHTLVLGDDASLYKPCPGVSSLEITHAENGSPPLHRVLDATYTAQLVTGDFQHQDFDYKKPNTPLKSTPSSEKPPQSFGKKYEYPGNFLTAQAGDALAHIRLEEAACFKTTLNGKSTAPFLTPGHTYHLQKHPRQDINKTYAVYSVAHTLRLQEDFEDDPEIFYANTFISFPHSVTFRPPRLTARPRISGSQTAVVTGKSGEEIWANEYGCIKVKFHWDHTSTHDEKSSCWIRVSHMWAAGGWGALFTPRVGMEVVLSFLEGDPDQPLVTGVVYNGAHKPPYLPNEPTKSTLKSHSTPSGSGFNEIRFEDKKAHEEIWVQAEKDMNMLIKHDRSTRIQTGNDTLDIQKGNRNTHIQHHDTKTLTEGNETTVIEKGNRTITLKNGNHQETVHGNYTLDVQGDLTITAKGNIHIKTNQSYTLQALSSITQKATATLTQEAGTDMKLKANLNLSLQASLAFKAEGGVTAKVSGGTAGSLESQGITRIQGLLVKVN